MRHSNSGRKLGRNPSHRKALLRNMAKALVVHGRITTTEAKAKTLRGVVEPLITLALKNDLHARRQAYRILGEHQLVARLFDDLGPLFADGKHKGGYTRVVKLALPRKGDAAALAIIEFVKQPAKAASAEEGDKKAKSAAKADAPVKKAPAKKAEAAEKPAKAAPKKKAAAEAEAPKKPRKKKADEAAE